MDPLAHTLAGAALAETGLGRSTRLSFPALVIGANLPDLDALTYVLAEGDVSLGFRRGWTHGVLAAVVLPLALWGVLLAWDRAFSRRDPDRAPLRRDRLLVLCGLAVLTHPLLDGLNTYGVRFLMPFDGTWFYGDSVFIVDPWLWMILGGAVLLARRGGRRDLVLWILLGAAATLVVAGPARLVPVAAKGIWFVGIGALAVLRMTVSGRLPGPRIAAAGVILATIYIAAMVAGGSLARGRVTEELARQGITPRDLMVGPMPANPLSWDVVAETEVAYHHGRFRWGGSPALELRGVIPKPADSPVLEAARRAPWVQGALGWMRFPFALVEEAGDGYRVYFLDARYVRELTTGFGAAVVSLDAQLEPRRPGS